MDSRLYLLLPLLGLPVIALGLGSIPGTQDPNRIRVRASEPAPIDFDEIFLSGGDDTRTLPLAKAFFPGPASSFSITLMIRNDSEVEVTNIVLDLFECLDGDALVAEIVFSAPSSTSVLYPQGYGRGPIVASFQGFSPGELVSLSFDPDTYENPNFGATVGDMAGARIGVVFSDGSKGVGVFRGNLEGATVAEVLESSP